MGKAYESLSEQDKELIDAYFARGWNQTKAWLEVHSDCPYESARTLASKHFAKVHMSDARAEIAKERVNALSDLKEKSIRELHNRAFFNPGDILDDNGMLKDGVLENPDLACCIESIDTVVNENYTHTKIKLADKDKALAHLVKITGLSKDTVDVNMNVVYIPEDHKGL